MACNIRDAASCAIRYGGLGIITTDWGDQGHWQYISASYPAFAHTGLYAWSGPGDEDSLISWYCNCFLYESPDESAYQAAWDLGNYYRLENAPPTTPLWPLPLCPANILLTPLRNLTKRWTVC